MHTRANLPRRRSATRGRVVLVAAVSLAVVTGGVAVTASMTSASYTDQANLNVGGDTGVGYQGRFDIGIVLPNGTVEQADTAAGYAWAVTDADKLVPGHSVTTQIPVFNNTADLASDTTMTVIARNGDGAVGPSVPNITPYLRFTAQKADGTVLFANATLADAHAALGTLNARGQAALTQGNVYTAGSAGSESTVTITINYLDAPGVENLNGGQSAVSVRFDATSKKP